MKRPMALLPRAPEPSPETMALGGTGAGLQLCVRGGLTEPLSPHQDKQWFVFPASVPNSSPLWTKTILKMPF